MPQPPDQGIRSLPGISAAISEANRLILEYAPLEDLVFLTGEPGTERSIAARLIHLHSSRPGGPLSRATASWRFPPDLPERFRQCDGGTMVITLQRELGAEMQYSLLEMVGEQALGDPAGGDPIEADVRFVISTSRDLEGLVSRGALLPELADLLLRRHIEIPPLRDRPEDIPALVRYAIHRARSTGRTRVRGADAQVLALFRLWDWPGNAEDLLMVTAESALASTSPLITLEDLPGPFVESMPEELVERAREVRLPSPGPPAVPMGADWQSVATFDEGTAGDLSSEETGPLDPEEVEALAAQRERKRRRGGPGEASRSDARPETHRRDLEELVERHRRLLALARRLSAQSRLLTDQVSSARGPAGKPSPAGLGEPEDAETLLNAVEQELDSGVDSILALRRHLALLRKKEQEALEAARDIGNRLALGDQDVQGQHLGEEFRQETAELTGQLRLIDQMVQRISGEQAVPEDL